MTESVGKDAIKLADYTEKIAREAQWYYKGCLARCGDEMAAAATAYAFFIVGASAVEDMMDSDSEVIKDLLQNVFDGRFLITDLQKIWPESIGG